MSTAFWSVAYHTNSFSSRARRWYRVSRLIEVDGKIFELYWHPSESLRGNSLADIRAKAKAAGIDLMPGTYTTAPYRSGAEIVRAREVNT